MARKSHIGTLAVLVILMMTGGAAATRAQSSAQSQKPAPLKLDRTNPSVCAGDTITIHAQRGATDAADVKWTFEPNVRGPETTTDKGTLNYQAPLADKDEKEVARVGQVGAVKVTASSGEEKISTSIQLAGVCEPSFGGEMARFTVGYEQVGAAGVDSTQRYSLDAFLSRPVPLYRSDSADNKYFGPRTRWWGSVRIGSYPQQVNGEIAKFAKDFATSAGKIKVNELVRSAEFETGPEIRLFSSAVTRRAMTEGTEQRFALMAFFGWGGIGPLPPVTDATPFVVPTDKDSPQGKAFFDANKDVTSKYVAFVPPTSNRFLSQWTVGLRLYTFSVASAGNGTPLQAPPAIVEFGWGKNELVAADRKVFRASAFYPFAFGDRTKPDTLIVYFFGDAVMGRGSAVPSPSFFLAPAVDASNNPIPLTDPGVTILSVDPNNRDTYRIGLAVDLMRLWKKLNSGGSLP